MIDTFLQDGEQRMGQAVDHLRHELAGIRTGYASPTLLEELSVDYYGQSTPLKQIAGISAPEARLLVVQPWDQAALPDIEKAIIASDLGITPSNDGRVIHLPIPPLSEDRRRDLVRIVRQRAEDGSRFATYEETSMMSSENWCAKKRLQKTSCDVQSPAYRTSPTSMYKKWT